MEFWQPSRLLSHIAKYHTLENNWSASGSRQLRLAAALYDRDMIRKVHASNVQLGNYLARSARIIRDQVTCYPHVLTDRIHTTTNIDKLIRVINYEDGPMYCDVGYVRARGNQIRRLGNTYFTQNVYTAAARSALREEARVEKVHTALIGCCTDELSSMIQNGLKYGSRFSVIFSSPRAWIDICLIFWRSAKDLDSSSASRSTVQ